MDLLLIDRNTILNRMVRYTTKSDWGHVCVVIGDVAYEFGHDERRKTSLSSLVNENIINKADLFHLETFGGDSEAEDHYEYLFNNATYDTKALLKLFEMGVNNRGYNNIQTCPMMHTCSNMIAKVYHDMYMQVGLTPDFMHQIHWSQIVPGDYSKLEKIAELK